MRAWLATVISPMGDALRVGTRMAGDANWTFRSYNEDFEYLWRIPDMLAPRFLPNLQQFLRFDPGVAKLVAAHDAAREGLRIACKAAFRGLRSLEEFLALHEAMTAEFVVAGGAPDSLHAAEHVVNGLRDLDHGWTGRDAWRMHGERFLGLRIHPSVKNEFDAVRAAGEMFLGAACRLRDAVDSAQAELADRFGLPPVPADERDK